VMTGYVYILKSLKNGRYYVGSTKDIERRFGEHRLGKVKSTRNIRPLELKYFEKFNDIVEARKIEYQIKRKKSRTIIEDILDRKNIAGLMY